MVTSLAACGSDNSSATSANLSTSTNSTTASSGEAVAGKFAETKTISVEVFDRAVDGGTKPEDNFYTKYIKEGMLRDYNVDVKFIPVPRWTEVEVMNNLLAAGTAPDVCLTYNYPTVQTYAKMGGILDLNKYLDSNKQLLPDLYSLLGDELINWNKEPDTSSIWAIESILFHNKRTNTFVREDWLKKLNISEPTTLEEFEAMLKAFKDNASTLLGANANKIIPFSLSVDAGYRAEQLTGAYIPNNYTDSDKDYFVNDFDDRNLTRPGIKNGFKKLNDWYNAGLIWTDFPLYPAGDKTEDNLLKAGYVGAFIHNWDYPYRNGDDGIAANLKKLVGPDAAYIAVECFKNDAGVYKKYLTANNDRKIFLPATNKEPVASLLYLNWISKLENRKFLQIGEKGATHEVLADGSVKSIAITGDKYMNSPYNIDYTITINGLDLGDPALNVKSIALGYAGIDAKYITKAFDITSKDAYIKKHVNVGAIKAEEGMGPALKEKRDNMLVQAITATPDKFDSVFDNGLKDWLASGGQAIMDERAVAYDKYHK
ncbi:MAG: type 2 periplasmic-binding domain-containing protein [Ruminiclostridium sp.]